MWVVHEAYSIVRNLVLWTVLRWIDGWGIDQMKQVPVFLGYTCFQFQLFNKGHLLVSGERIEVGIL